MTGPHSRYQLDGLEATKTISVGTRFSLLAPIRIRRVLTLCSAINLKPTDSRVLECHATTGITSPPRM